MEAAQETAEVAEVPAAPQAPVLDETNGAQMTDAAIALALDGMTGDEEDQGAGKLAEEKEPAADADATPGDAALEAEPEPEAQPPVLDAELNARLDKIQAAEERSRRAIDTYRLEQDKATEAKLAEMQPQLQAAEEFKALKQLAAYDPAAVLAKLGYSPDDMETAAQQIYSMRPGADNKTERATAARVMQQRQAQTALDEVKAQMATMREELASRDAAAEQATAAATMQASVATFMTSVQTAAESTATPWASRILATTPDRAQAELRRHADALCDEFGEMPEPSAVVARYEKELAQQMAGLGVTLPKTNPEPKAGEISAAKTITPEMGTPQKSTTSEDIDAEIIRGLEEMSR